MRWRYDAVSLRAYSREPPRIAFHCGRSLTVRKPWRSKKSTPTVACWAVAGTVLLLGQVYTFGSRELAAPQATLMKTIIEGVLSGALPWGLVLTGAGVSIAAMLCGVSGLAFAIGVYLPFGTMATIYVGGCLRAFADRRWKSVQGESDPGVLAASGLVAGEGLAGVLIALLVALKVVGKAGEPRLGGVAGSVATLLVLALASVFLVLAGKARRSNA